MISLEEGETSETAQLMFVILGCIYAIISIYAFIRALSTYRIASDSKLARYFYVSLLCESLISTGCFFFLGLFDFYHDSSAEQKGDRLFWSIVLIPDIMYLISYGILFWQLFKLLLEGHIHVSAEVHIPYIRNKGLGYKILLWGLIGYLLLQLMFCILYLTQVIKFVDFVLQLSIVVTIV